MLRRSIAKEILFLRQYVEGRSDDQVTLVSFEDDKMNEIIIELRPNEGPYTGKEFRLRVSIDSGYSNAFNFYAINESEIMHPNFQKPTDRPSWYFPPLECMTLLSFVQLLLHFANYPDFSFPCLRNHEFNKSSDVESFLKTQLKVSHVDYDYFGVDKRNLYHRAFFPHPDYVYECGRYLFQEAIGHMKFQPDLNQSHFRSIYHEVLCLELHSSPKRNHTKYLYCERGPRHYIVAKLCSSLALRNDSRTEENALQLGKLLSTVYAGNSKDFDYLKYMGVKQTFSFQTYDLWGEPTLRYGKNVLLNLKKYSEPEWEENVFQIETKEMDRLCNSQTNYVTCHWPYALSPGSKLLKRNLFFYDFLKDLSNTTRCNSFSTMVKVLRITKQFDTPAKIVLFDTLALDPSTPMFAHLNVSSEGNLSTEKWTNVFKLSGGIMDTVVCIFGLLLNYTSLLARTEAYQCLGYSRCRPSHSFKSGLFNAAIDLPTFYISPLSSVAYFDTWPLCLVSWFSNTVFYKVVAAVYQPEEVDSPVTVINPFVDLDEL